MSSIRVRYCWGSMKFRLMISAICRWSLRSMTSRGNCHNWTNLSLKSVTRPSPSVARIPSVVDSSVARIMARERANSCVFCSNASSARCRARRILCAFCRATERSSRSSSSFGLINRLRECPPPAPSPTRAPGSLQTPSHDWSRQEVWGCCRLARWELSCASPLLFLALLESRRVTLRNSSLFPFTKGRPILTAC